jgi:cytochrome P450
MRANLPPGPRVPVTLQTIGWWSRPTAYVERLRDRYGSRFTLRLLGQPTFVTLSDPEDLRVLFAAPPDVLHPGEGARLLEPIVGSNSVILLDEDPHLEQRRLMLPAFHGERMQRLTGLMAELTDRELDGWPTDTPVALHERLQRLTMEIILRAVFGLDEGARLDELRERLTAILSFGDSPCRCCPRPRSC